MHAFTDVSHSFHSSRTPPPRQSIDAQRLRGDGNVRGVMSFTLLIGTAILIVIWLSAESRAQTPAALSGAWTLNSDLSDRSAEPGSEHNDQDRGRRGGGRRGGGGFGGGRGGFGRGGGGFGPAPDREGMARMREAIRDVMTPSDHLTITQTESMIVITGADGRTTRLAPDGSKVKDENTNIERKTRWDGDKLLSEINGLGHGKITQTFSVDPEHQQLRIVALLEGGGGQPHTITHVYDADSR
jgi:hypothetical protein